MARLLMAFVVCFVLLGLTTFCVYGRSIWVPAVQGVVGVRTVDDVLFKYGSDARERMVQRFKAAAVEYPPNQITLLAVKDNALLEVWAGSESSPVYIHTYPIRALSGRAGPKLREGDRQVPEGIYKVVGLNPNSSYHLSMKLNYPNAFDLRHARAEGRGEPGTNIFIHGRSVSIGCLAMGDTVIEELFVLSADVGRANVDVVIAPTDPRHDQLVPVGGAAWVEELYQRITEKFMRYPRQTPAQNPSL